MKKHTIKLITLLLIPSFLSACNNNEKTIVIGATPSPHAEILNSKVIKDYIESQGYHLKVQIYQDYVTPNKALDDEGIDANYFQHLPYLTKELEKGYQIGAVCQVHNEPLNLYSANEVNDFSNKTISIVNDASNVERAYKLLLANNIIDSYSVENFNAQHPEYTSAIGVKIECLDPGLLNIKVNEGGLAVIPGNYALTAWGSKKASEYVLLGESLDVAYPNIIAVKNKNLNSIKTDIVDKALSQPSLKTFIEDTYGPTVNYCFLDLRK